MRLRVWKRESGRQRVEEGEEERVRVEERGWKREGEIEWKRKDERDKWKVVGGRDTEGGRLMVKREDGRETDTGRERMEERLMVERWGTEERLMVKR